MTTFAEIIGQEKLNELYLKHGIKQLEKRHEKETKEKTNRHEKKNDDEAKRDE